MNIYKLLACYKFRLPVRKYVHTHTWPCSEACLLVTPFVSGRFLYQLFDGTVFSEAHMKFGESDPLASVSVSSIAPTLRSVLTTSTRRPPSATITGNMIRSTVRQAPRQARAASTAVHESSDSADAQPAAAVVTRPARTSDTTSSSLHVPYAGAHHFLALLRMARSTGIGTSRIGGEPPGPAAAAPPSDAAGLPMVTTTTTTTSTTTTTASTSGSRLPVPGTK